MLSGAQALVEVASHPDVDAVMNSTPDHWHAPGTWLALERGKHVYVEKPCSHNPREGELLIALQKKYNKVVQMGNQQRSAPESREIIAAIHNGAIGKAFIDVFDESAHTIMDVKWLAQGTIYPDVSFLRCGLKNQNYCEYYWRTG